MLVHATQDPAPRPGPGTVLAALFAVNVLNYYDRQLLGASAEPLRHAFGLSDAQLGLLSTAFTLVYAAAGLPLGRLSDRLPRTRVLAIGVLAFSLCTALTGMAQGFASLLLCRVLVGVGEASCAPAAAALCADLFPPQRRARAMGVFMLGLPVGVALSFGIGGPLARSHGFRLGFWLAALPGVIAALWALRLPEPPRAARPASGPAARSPWRRLLLDTPTLPWLCAAGVLHTLLMQVLALFLSPYFIRVHGLDVRSAGLWSMVCFGLSGVPGLLLGGGVGDVVARRWAAGKLAVGAASSLLVAPLLVLALQAPPGQVWTMALALAPACGLLYVYYSTVYAALQDAAPPDLRATAMAVYLCAMYLLGAALGPLLAGMLSDHFARAAQVAAGGSGSLEPFRAAGLRGALSLLPAAALALAGVLYGAARRRTA